MMAMNTQRINSHTNGTSQANPMKQCPVCSNNTNTPLCSINQFQIVKCPECECDYVINPPNELELEHYYSREEWFEGGEFGGYDQYDEQTRDSLGFIGELLATHGEAKGSILDMGCGYGSHLKIAADLGWKCFGVEPSEHARSVAIDRLGDSATIVASTKELMPHTFNIILMLDVLEHVSNPYKLLYPLFALGAIQPQTVIIATTPNAGSVSATSDPAHWEYRHPPSHLTYFTNTSLEVFFHALRFSHVKVEGMHATQSTGAGDSRFSNYAGLLVTASGSDFHNFMQERYVPSTWSEIAEYEHFPRYELACRFAPNQNVLDFGCGTGYGTAMLAAVAENSLGVDIDKSALDWARRCHRRGNLSFVENNNFLKSFEDNCFDLITCFEMIEHVNESDQEKAITAFARVLRQDGVLLISTPNPEITSLYGPNPYHLRERNREEFIELLSSSFQHVKIVDQYALAGVFFAAEGDSYTIQSLQSGNIADAKPLAYIALCSHESKPRVENLGFVDTNREYISTQLQRESRITQLSLEAYQKKEAAAELYRQLAEVKDQHPDEWRRNSEHEKQLIQIKQHLTKAEDRCTEQERLLSQVKLQLAQVLKLCAKQNRRLCLEENTKWARLGSKLRSTMLYQKIRVFWRTSHADMLRMQVAKRLAIKTSIKLPIFPLVLEAHDASYIVRQPLKEVENRPIVLHAIANFCLGGSSRLVVDLIESLGEYYEQPVVTRHVPRPAAYINLTLHEYRKPTRPDPFIALIEHYHPACVHIHYWGDCDQDWYEQVFKACELKGIPIVQNINTPIAPHCSDAVIHNIYVSEYVLKTYGGNDPKAIVIPPGSDLDHFSTPDLAFHANDCIGMVYRLDNDKLNEGSIDVFIEVAKRRPSTRCLIVGDGSLRQIFESKVAQAGVIQNFEFTGYISYEDLPRYYQQMSIFITPVWKESFGQVASFAMNMGIPVVGYATGAIPSIISDDSLVADYGDIHGLADIVIDLLDDRPRRLTIGQNNHERAQTNYCVSKMVKRYSEVYATLCTTSEE
jgi:glycosyltransferase involved in cell wall biosynthesis/2-polyprenyl-3-methyl-5-hydroxy-6-metoxy-1,4-benzoquinol methylase